MSKAQGRRHTAHPIRYDYVGILGRKHLLLANLKIENFLGVLLKICLRAFRHARAYLVHL